LETANKKNGLEVNADKYKQMIMVELE